jgi:hypothetical protein
MHNESLNQETSSLSDALDQRLTRALETAPIPQIPPGFAARISATVPVRPPVSIQVTHYGRSATLIGIVLLLAAMLALSARTVDPSTFNLVLEWTLFALFLSLTVWFSTNRHNAN